MVEYNNPTAAYRRVHDMSQTQLNFEFHDVPLDVMTIFL